MEERRARAPQIGLAAAVLLLPMLLLATGAYADVPIPGMKGYDNNYIISNIDEYTEYLFLTSSTIWGWKYTSLINHATGSFGGGYKLDGFRLYAVKESDFDPAIFSAGSSEDRVNCADYCKGNKKIISSSIDLPVSRTVNSTVPLSQVTVYLKVSSISDASMDVAVERTVYTYDNGTSLDVPLQNMG